MIVRAKVKRGRLVVDEPTDLPEGAELTLVVVPTHAEDGLDTASREALDKAIEAALDEVDRGDVEDGDAVLERIRQRSA